MLRLENVSRHFGPLKAVDDVSFDMSAGELRAVIGPNGAGKTTFFNLISGLLPPTAGRIWFDGKNITRQTIVQRVAQGIVRTFQITEILPDLTVFENIRVAVETAAGLNSKPWISRATRITLDRRVGELIETVGLHGKDDRVVGELAHGDQRVVEVAAALSLNPRLLLLDEPTAGMGDTETENMVNLVRRLHAERGVSILFIEHDMDIVFGIAQRITVLDQGRVLADGTPDMISANPMVRAAYLGIHRMTKVLRARDLHTYYSKSHILHGVSLEVNEGEIVTLLGRNGAGKTTTVRSLMGLTPPRSVTPSCLARTRRAGLRTGSPNLASATFPEGRKIFGGLTVLENLKVPPARAGSWDINRVFKLFPRLEERKSQLGRQLSGGEQEMLAIARPLLLNPRLMLLDEPSQGLAPLIIKEVMNIVRRMRQEGLSVLLIEQNAPLSLSIADRAYVLDDGKVVYSGDAVDLAKDTELVNKLAGAGRNAATSP